MDYGNLVSTTTSADLVVCSVTLASATTYLLMTLGGAFTTYSATEAGVGIARIQADLTGGGFVTKFEQRYQNTDLDNNCGCTVLPLGAGIDYAAGEDVRAIETATGTTSTRWNASFWGTKV